MCNNIIKILGGVFMRKFSLFLMVFVMLFSCANIHAEQLAEAEYNTSISGDIVLNLNDDWQPNFVIEDQHINLPYSVCYAQAIAFVRISGNTDADSIIVENPISSSLNQKIGIDENGNFDQEVKLVLTSIGSSNSDRINFEAYVLAVKGGKTLRVKIGKGELKTNFLIDLNNLIEEKYNGTINAIDYADIRRSYLDYLPTEYKKMDEQEKINAYIYNEWFMKEFEEENGDSSFVAQNHLKAKIEGANITLDLDNNLKTDKHEYLTDATGKIDEIIEFEGVVPSYQSHNVAAFASAKVFKGKREIELQNRLRVREADKALVGDVDGNGEVNSIDFMYLRKYIMGQIEKFPVESGFYCADVDDSRYINAIDFAYIRKYLLGMIKDFPKESNNVDSVTTTPTPPNTVTQTPTPGTGMVTYYYVNNIDVVKNPGVEIFVDKSPESKVWVSAQTVCHGPLYADGWGATYFSLGGNAINGVDYEAIDFGYFWREIGYGFMDTSTDNPKRGFYITPIDTGTDETKYVEIYFGGSTKPDAVIHFVKNLNDIKD